MRNSPFRDGKNVDERVRRLLETADDTFDLYAFANEFGQHVVEKAFCGGFLCLRFSKVGSTEDAWQGSCARLKVCKRCSARSLVAYVFFLCASGFVSGCSVIR